MEPFEAPDSGRIPQALLTPDGRYRWHASDLPMRAGRIASRNALSVHFRVPPREIIFCTGDWRGVFIMLSTLRAELRRAINCCRWWPNCLGTSADRRHAARGSSSMKIA